MKRRAQSLNKISNNPIVFSLLVLTGLVLALRPATALASGSPPVVDAGPAKVMAFPAKDLTLFGHATDPENDPLTVEWRMTSGPGTVT